MLRNGLTIEAVVAERGVLPHSARALICTLNKRAKLGVVYDRITRIYKAAA